MTTLPNSEIPSSRLAQRVALPLSGKEAPGPIHTVVVDDEGNIYYSDEFNHTVGSLTSCGAVRWLCTRSGTAPGEFRNPRGLSIGWVRKDEQSIRCLAVCDALNRRLQFLDLEGNPLEAWSQAGDAAFIEVSDVRFVSGRRDEPSTEGQSWMVLDRGAHSLLGLDPSGRLCHAIGRCFPSGLERNWGSTRIFFEDDPFHPAATTVYPPYDFLHYPDRIVGCDPQMVYVTQVRSSVLKAVRPPYILPLGVDSPAPREWIAGDASGFICWEPADSRVVRCNGGGEPVARANVRGIPLRSNAPLCEYWLQEGSLLERWIWDGEEPTSSSFPARDAISLAARSALEDLGRIELGKVIRAVKDCFQIADEELGQVETIRRCADTPQSAKELGQALESFAVIRQRRPRSVEVLIRTLHDWCLGMLKCRLLGVEPEIPSNLREEVRSGSHFLIDEISRRLRKMEALKGSFDAARRGLEIAAKPDPAAIDAWIVASREGYAALIFLNEWIESWSGLAANLGRT